MDKKALRLLVISLVILVVIVGAVAFILAMGDREPQEIRVACIGDSLTQSTVYTQELWKLLGSGGQYTVGNYTIPPDTRSNGTRYAVGNFGVGSTTLLLNTDTPYMGTGAFQSALDFQPNIVIIMLGTNDAQPNLRVENASLVGDYLTLINAFKALDSKPEIWAVLPPPLFSNQSGKIDPEYFKSTVIPAIQQAANEANVPTIDVFSALQSYPQYFPDGEHPNREGAVLMANKIYAGISQKQG